MPSPFTDQFWRALADYKIVYPNLGSLGASAATWLIEYARVKRTAFAAVKITSNSSEGGSASGVGEFPQQVLLDALHCRRRQLDSTYELPEHLADLAARVVERRRGNRSFILQFQS